MSTDDMEKQLQDALGGKALPGGANRSLGSGAADEMAEMLAGQKDAPLYVILAYDVTSSMSPYIDIVRVNAGEVSRRVFDEETGIQIAVYGVGDHVPSERQYLSQFGHSFGIFEREEIDRNMHWLQTNSPTSDFRTLERQIDGIERVHGWDIPEAYECAWKEIALDASRLKRETPTSKVAVAFIGDSIPHGMGFYGGDLNCPDQVDFRQSLASLKSVTDMFYFVGCSENQELVGLQQKLITPDRPNEKYLKLGNMVDDLPELLIAGIKLVRDAGSYATYLNALPSGKAANVARMLGPPPGA